MNHFDLPVEEYTTPNPVTGTKEMSIEDLSKLMKKHGVRHIPIVDQNAVVGIVSERDLRVISGLTQMEKILVLASDIMVSNPVTVTADMSLGDVAFEMSRLKIGSVIVNDENNKFLGIFTVTDALNALIELSRYKSSDHLSKALRR